MRRVFSASQRRILSQLSETLLDPPRMVISVEQVVQNIEEHFSRIDGNKPYEIGLALYAIWVKLGGPLFSNDSLDGRRQRVRRRLQNTSNDLNQDLARLRGVIYAGYYGHWTGNTEDDNRNNPVLHSLGYTLPEHRDRTGDLEIKRNTSRDLKHDVYLAENSIPDTVEVIVIGSGAGGAVAAANMVKQGHEVLIIEAGRPYPSSQITPEEARMTARLYKDGALQTTTDNDIIIFQGRVVGGSPVINNGICLRLDEGPGFAHPDAKNVLSEWQKLGADIPPSDLDDAYDAIETRLNIQRVPQRLGRNNGTHLLHCWDAYVATSSDPMDQRAPAPWFRKNWGNATNDDERCVASGYCNTGCPYGRKTAMPESFLADATRKDQDKPALILPQTKARRIIWDKSCDEWRATGVEITSESGTRCTIKATKGVIVAAGTIASSNILHRSDIAETGKDISLNIACPVAALMPHNVHAWDEDQMATYIDRGDFLIESHFQPPMSMATLVPGWFDEHFSRMLAYNRLASAGVLFPADRRGRISRKILHKGKLHFKLEQEDLQTLRTALAVLTKLHFAHGALEVYPALLKGQTLHKKSDDQSLADFHAGIDAFFAENIVEPDDVVLSSSHPHGGNIINADPDKGVVDLDQKVHGTSNVYVADASVMPSCIRVNAQLTTMAMSWRATHKPLFT